MNMKAETGVMSLQVKKHQILPRGHRSYSLSWSSLEGIQLLPVPDFRLSLQHSEVQ